MLGEKHVDVAWTYFSQASLSYLPFFTAVCKWMRNRNSRRKSEGKCWVGECEHRMVRCAEMVLCYGCWVCAHELGQAEPGAPCRSAHRSCCVLRLDQSDELDSQPLTHWLKVLVSLRSCAFAVFLLFSILRSWLTFTQVIISLIATEC